MSRRRRFDEPEVVHTYWPHSDPEPPTAQASAGIRKAGMAHGTHTHALGETPCPGQCNRAFRAAENAAMAEVIAAGQEDREPNPTIVGHDVVFHPGNPVWCTNDVHVQGREVVVDRHGCAERITADLARIPELAANLTPGPLNTPRDVNSTGTRSSNLSQPTASPGWDEADELVRWALALEDQLRDRLEQPLIQPKVKLYLTTRVEVWQPPLAEPIVQWWALPARATTTPPRTLSDAIRYLTAYSTALLSGPDAGKVGRSIMNRKTALEQGTGQDRLVHRLPEPCNHCGRKGLSRKDGDDLVKCRFCRACWDAEHYELMAKAYADDVRRRGA